MYGCAGGAAGEETVAAPTMTHALIIHTHTHLIQVQQQHQHLPGVWLADVDGRHLVGEAQVLERRGERAWGGGEARTQWHSGTQGRAARSPARLVVHAKAHLARQERTLRQLLGSTMQFMQSIP